MQATVKKQRASRLTPWTTPVRDIAIRSKATQAFSVSPKLERLVAALGVNTTADVLGVDRSQLSRCLHGKEAISSEVARRIAAVEYVIDRAMSVLHPEEIGPWLTSPNAMLGERVPLNVLTREGASPLIDALESLYAGVLV